MCFSKYKLIKRLMSSALGRVLSTSFTKVYLLQDYKETILLNTNYNILKKA